MKNSNGNALIAGVLVTACMLIVGGLVAWGAGAFGDNQDPAQVPAGNGATGGGMNLPEGHPPIGDLTASPGPVRPDAPAGACPVSAPAAAAATDGCACCPPSGAAAEADPAAEGDSCCPEPEKKECGGDECTGNGSCGDCEEAKAN